jgi:guanosine-3',5'-bis(diphosphate) 3'-pyrophosphohydrolase
MTSKPPSRPNWAAAAAAEEGSLTSRDAGPLQAPVPRAPEGTVAGIAPAPVPGLEEAMALARRVAGYDPRADVALLERAGQTAAEAHAAQKRENGDPYITHPIAVANILADYRLDSATIATALLHDVAEDTSFGLNQIERRFGGEVARLVDGVTKLGWTTHKKSSPGSSCNPSAPSRRRTSASWSWR